MFFFPACSTFPIGRKQFDDVCGGLLCGPDDPFPIGIRDPFCGREKFSFRRVDGSRPGPAFTILERGDIINHKVFVLHVHSGMRLANRLAMREDIQHCRKVTGQLNQDCVTQAHDHHADSIAIQPIP